MMDYQVAAQYKNIKKILDMLSDNMAQSFLRKQKTREYQNAQFKKTGMLDTELLFKYKLSDDIFTRKQIDHSGKSYGFIMLLDMSGSMSDIYLECAIEIILLVKFCRKIGVPFEVYGFLDSLSGRGVFNAPRSHFKLLNFFSSKSNKKDFEDHCRTFYGLAENACSRRYGYYEQPDTYVLGGTPLNNTLYKTFSIVDDFCLTYNKDINHLIVLTDGSPSDSILSIEEHNPVNRLKQNNRTTNIIKIQNKSYFYNPISFYQKLKNDINFPHSELGPLVYTGHEQYFLLSCMKNHFGSKLKLHKLYIENNRSRRTNRTFNGDKDSVQFISTKAINSKLYYDTETILSSDVFKCFGNIFSRPMWDDEEQKQSDNISINRQMSKIAKQMEKTLSKTKELRMVCEKIVDLLSRN